MTSNRTSKLADLEMNLRLAREIERERHERVLHDEERAGLALDEEFRLKDARENPEGAGLRRPNGQPGPPARRPRDAPLEVAPCPRCQAAADRSG